MTSPLRIVRGPAEGQSATDDITPYVRQAPAPVVGMLGRQGGRGASLGARRNQLIRQARAGLGWQNAKASDVWLSWLDDDDIRLPVRMPTDQAEGPIMGRTQLLYDVTTGRGSILHSPHLSTTYVRLHEAPEFPDVDVNEDGPWLEQVERIRCPIYIHEPMVLRGIGPWNHYAKREMYEWTIHEDEMYYRYSAAIGALHAKLKGNGLYD